MNHTPTQFPFEDDLRIGQSEPYFPFQGARFKQVQICAGDRVVANVPARGGDAECLVEAEYIKTACSAHEELVEQAKLLKDWNDQFQHFCHIHYGKNFDFKDSGTAKAFELLRKGALEVSKKTEKALANAGVKS